MVCLTSCRRVTAMFALSLFVLGIGTLPADARDRESLQYLDSTDGDKISLNDRHRRALAYSVNERPPWLKRVVAKLQARRGPNAELTQLVLFKQHGKPTYLVLGWLNDKGSIFRTVEIHRIKLIAPQKVILQGIWEAREWLVHIVEPTGHDVYGDGLPTVFIEIGSGGSDYSGYRLLVLRLGRTLRSLEPVGYQLRPIIAADLLGDGRHALVASDDRWAQYFYGCGACGPFVPTVFVWRKGSYRPACKDFRRYFRERIALIKPYMKEPAGEDASYTSWKNVEYETDIILSLIQMGRVDEGIARYHAMIERARSNDAPGHVEPYFDPETVEDVARDIGPAIEAATLHSTAACPLLETPSEGAHPGWGERVRRIR